MAPFELPEPVYKAPTFNLADMTASKLFAGEPPPLEWLVQGTFPAGRLCIIGSAGGVGKSFMGLHLSLQICRPRNPLFPPTAFGANVMQQGRCLVISGEDDRSECHRRIHALLSEGEEPPGNLHVLSVPDGCPDGLSIVHRDPQTRSLEVSPQWEQLEQEIVKLPDLKLIVIDTLSALAGPANANDSSEMQCVMNALTRLATRTKATILILHHLSKHRDIQTMQDAADSLRGSSAIISATRAGYVMWPASPQEAKRVCDTLNVEHAEGKIVMGVVAKLNSGKAQGRSVFLRADNGLLVDVTMRYYRHVGGNDDAMREELYATIEAAYLQGVPFAAGRGETGIHARRFELADAFHEKSLPWFTEQVGKLIKDGRIRYDKRGRGNVLKPAVSDDSTESDTGIEDANSDSREVANIEES